MTGRVIAIEGGIGAGKTTAGCILKDTIPNSKFFEEKVTEDLLQLFLDDMKKYAFAFQLSMLESRINTQREARQFAENGGIAFIDRSTIGDRAFALLQYEKGNISEREWEVYESIFRKNTYHPDKIVYLDCVPQISLERIKKRDRSSETKDYTIDYLTSLSESYEKVLRTTFLIPITRIEWNSNRNSGEITKILSEVLEL